MTDGVIPARKFSRRLETSLAHHAHSAAMGTKMHLVGEVEVRNRLVVFALVSQGTLRVASTSVGFSHL